MNILMKLGHWKILQTLGWVTIGAEGSRSRKKGEGRSGGRGGKYYMEGAGNMVAVSSPHPIVFATFPLSSAPLLAWGDLRPQDKYKLIPAHVPCPCE